MGFVKVETRTNEIPQTILAPQPFSWPSGGGGGGGGGTTKVFPTNYKVGGAQAPGLITVPVNAEMDLASFQVNLTGGKPGVFFAYATFSGAVINATLKLYVNGTLVSKTTVTAGQSISWGTLIQTTAGANTLKISAENTGSVPLPVPSAETLVIELLQ